MGEVPGPYTVEEFRASDGYRWRYRRFPAPAAARAEVVYIHGIQSHGGWYEYSSAQLAQAGFAVSFLDRRGSGLNQQDRGDAPGFRRLLDDLAEFLAQVPRSVPRGNALGRLPLYLIAISWGGKLAVALERSHPGLVDGLALLCPGFFPRVYPSLRQRLRTFAARLIRPTKLFSIPLSDPELFTATSSWQKFLRDDPLRLHQATARLLVESARLDAYLRFAPKYVHVPILVLLAERDRIINNLRTRAYVERFATPKKQIIEYPGAHHTLEFEALPGPFIGDLKAWLEKQADEIQA